MSAVNPESSAHRKPRDGGSPPPDGLLADAGSLWESLHSVAHDYLVLIALETKRAGLSLAFIVAAGVGIALMLVTAWLGLAAAGAVAMIGAGLAPSLAILVVVAANLLIAFILYRFIASKRHDLAFPATVKSLRPGSNEGH